MNGVYPEEKPAVPLCQDNERLGVALADWEYPLFFPNGLDLGEAESQLNVSLGAWQSSLEAANPTCLLTGWGTPPLPEAWLASKQCRLKYICNVTGSIRRAVPRSFIERGGWVTNWGNLCAIQVAEHALLLALSASRNQPAWRSFMAEPRETRFWPDLQTRTLFHRQIGIHGFGNVARNLVRLLKPFQATIKAYSAGVPASLMEEMGVTQVASLRELFDGSDVIFECEALTEQSINSVDAELLARLSDGAVFVNVGRGRVVSEAALVAEAASGRLRVAVDVCEAEPHYLHSDIMETPEIILSPHIAGPTVDQFPNLGQHARHNLQRYLRGEHPNGLIDLENYDRST